MELLAWNIGEWCQLYALLNFEDFEFAFAVPSKVKVSDNVLDCEFFCSPGKPPEHNTFPAASNPSMGSVSI